MNLDLNLSLIWSIATNLLDICLVWAIIYFLFKNLKNNVKMVLIFKGVIWLLIIKLLSNVLKLYTVGVLLEYVVSWGPIALIIIFQPEIRNVL